MIDRTHDLPDYPPGEGFEHQPGHGLLQAASGLARDLRLMRRIDELHLERPFTGARMLRDFLGREGIAVGRRHVATLMKRMGIEAIYRRPNTSKPAPGHKIYPYRLRGVTVERPNQVWATDITYIPMARGFVYLVAVVDWFSRRVLSHRVSITMEAGFCVEALEEAIGKHGRPEIFNRDQGSQFTSEAFTGVLEKNGIAISMDGRGAWRDTRHGLDFILGVAPTTTLRRHVEALEAGAKARFEAAPRDGKLRRFKEFYDGAESWSRVERIIARVEVGAEGPDTRFVVTNLQKRNPRALYEDLYCRRGQAENHIKSLKTHLAADRTSCTKATANQFRLFLHAGAYWLMWGLRVSMPKRSMWRVAQFDTLRLRLIKIAARVVEMKTMIRVHLPTSCPAQDILRFGLDRIPRLVT